VTEENRETVGTPTEYLPNTSQKGALYQLMMNRKECGKEAAVDYFKVLSRYSAEGTK
jgi:hypothetical protein